MPTPATRLGDGVDGARYHVTPRILARQVIAARFVVTSRPRWPEVIVGLTSQVGSQTTAARPVDVAPRTTGPRVAPRSLSEASSGNACIPAAQVPRCD